MYPIIRNDVNIFQTRIAQFTKVWTPIKPDFMKYCSEHYQSLAGMAIVVEIVDMIMYV